MTDEQIDALILSALGRKRSVNAPEIDRAIFRTGMLEAARIVLGRIEREPGANDDWDRGWVAGQEAAAEEIRQAASKP